MRLKSSLINLKSKLSRSCNTFISSFHACFRNVDTKQRMRQIRTRSSSSSVIDDSRKMFPLALTRRKEIKSKMMTSERDMLKEDVVKEACRNFENYLIHMIVEEGRLDDVMDMEELHYYWKNLKSPIFVDIVTRFYGELCTDLFPSDHDD